MFGYSPKVAYWRAICFAPFGRHCGVTEDLSGRRYVLPTLIRQEVAATTARRVSIHGHERAPLIATVRQRLMSRAIDLAHAAAGNQHTVSWQPNRVPAVSIIF